MKNPDSFSASFFFRFLLEITAFERFNTLFYFIELKKNGCCII